MDLRNVERNQYRKRRMNQSNCRNPRGARILLVLLVLALVFIWGHSMAPAASSAEESRRVGQWLTPFLEWFVGEGNVTTHLVRKLAHFCEYGALGMILGALALLWESPGAFFRGSYAFLLALAAAVVDESIQLVADGRGAQVQDILLDAAGSLTGLLAAWLLAALLRLIRKRRVNKT